MRTESIPQAYVVRKGGAPSAARSMFAGARTVLAVAFALWPLTGTMLAAAAMMISL